MKRLLSILLWSVIAAAFIGPGTVTACATAGARHGYALLWALVFSTAGCFVLQEAAARVTVVSGLDLAQALRRRAARGAARLATLALVVGAIVIGCAAYQAGNILGAAAGAELGTGVARPVLTVATSALALGVLALGSAAAVSRAMGVVVALMGAAFLVTAARLAPAADELLHGALRPGIPDGAGLLIVGMIGTTIVPYNLFLGSALARGERLAELRFGLAVAVALGGVISMAVVVVGSAADGAFAFDGLAATLAERLGAWGGRLFAIGLFCAGFSSAVTAPLAAAVTTRGLFGKGARAWGERDWRYRGVWLLVLATGLGFGLSGLRPVPVILLAQVLNGLLLPVVAAALLLIVNDRQLMGERGLNRPLANAAFVGTFVITVLLGASNVLRAGAATLGLAAPGERTLLVIAGLVTAAISVPLLLAARRARER